MMWPRKAVPLADFSLLLCSSKHNKTAVQVKIREDMKKMVQLPVLKNLPTSATAGDNQRRGQRVFGVSLLELRKLGLVKDGVPSVLRSMVEYLRQHGLQQEGLFRVSASVRAVEILKQKLDKEEKVDLQQEAEVCTVASLLKLYLRELPEGLVHSSIHNTLLQMHKESKEDELCKNMAKLLLKLPDVHYSVLRYLCHFLTQVEQQQCHNRMTAFNLATVFGPNVFHYLEKTIRSAVKQHLFDAHMQPDQTLQQNSDAANQASFPTATARQRRRQKKEQEENQERSRIDINKENIPSCGLSSTASISISSTEESDRRRVSADEASRSRKPKLSPTVTELTYKRGLSSTPAMKIQEAINGPEPSDGCEDVPRLDLSTLMEDSNWGAYSSWHRDNVDSEEAHLSPHIGGKMISQLLEEDSDPMLSPRFYAYGNSQQYLDDTEVPPSPPNTHSFVSRRRSSSLGSCDNEREELTSSQLSKKIHSLKKKIRKFEEKFEEERKYRPSHSDKAANPEVLRWMNELAKLRKDLKEHSLLKSEEDLAPLPRQRSNTLPRSFGSQLEKKSNEPKTPKPPVESTLETDMTREQIGAEKVALQKALLFYEGIHGRPGSPSSKRRGPQLQPIIEGEPALFFDHSKEEEDGSDEDNDNKTQLTQLTTRPELSMLGFLDHLDEEVDGFISPVDEISPSNNSSDMRLSNLHAATIQELVEQLQEAREEKKRIRKNLREFEDQFFRQNGRNVQKEDRSPLALEYNEYKHVKAKLKLLEVLISKRDVSKFI
ncbi:Protein FAM13A [Bagarius yarrelli]|uniref:Protein FAM13A n=1 Tax=Bagarius yarrelli TaxID=175774 RepID=A0A556TMA2_BAGYA|nr:Protein FAM13A [Bagarius yarrelli]